MKRWTLTVSDEVVWFGDSTDKDQQEELARFMDVVHDNVLPGPIPSSDVFDQNNWKHLVRASMLWATDFFGVPEVASSDFTVDDVFPYLATPKVDGQVRY